MANDALPSLDDLVSERLEEFLFGGHITQIQYQEAILGHALPLRALAGYLEACACQPFLG